MPKVQRQPGSLQSEGYTTLGVSVPTKNMIKQLAGDMPMSDYLKKLAIRELRGKPGLPGQEKAVSENTLPAMNSKLDKILYLVSHADDYVFGMLGYPPAPPRNDYDKMIAFLEQMVMRLKAKAYILQADKSQAEFELGHQG